MPRSIIILLMLTCIPFALSCDEAFILVKCSDCQYDEPTQASLEIKTDNSGGYLSTVYVYEGNIEDSILFYRGSNYSGNYIVIVPLNRVYTCRVDYLEKSTGNVYRAINSVFPQVKTDKKCSDYTCYYVYGNTVNMNFKYH